MRIGRCLDRVEVSIVYETNLHARALVRPGIAVAKDDETDVAETLPFPSELVRVGPEELKHLCWLF